MPSVSRVQKLDDNDVFVAIAHPVRRDILDKLVKEDMNASRIAGTFKVSRSAVSQHLTILVDSGLVNRNKQGREQVYSIQADNLAEVYRWVQKFEQFWSQRLDLLGDLLDDMADEED